MPPLEYVRYDPAPREPEIELLDATQQIAKFLQDYGDLGSPRLAYAQRCIRRALEALSALS